MTTADILKWILGIFGSLTVFTIGFFIRWVFAQFTLQREINKDISDTLNDKVQELEDKVFSNTVHEKDCEGKQELWGERFENMMKQMEIHMAQNKIEHAEIIATMEKSDAARNAQIADFALSIDELKECVRRLELGKEC